MDKARVAVLYETFVSFRFREVEDMSVLNGLVGCEHALDYKEMRDVLCSLCKMDPIVTIGGMYPVALHLRDLGFDVTYFARVGDDELGQELVKLLHGSGVHTVISCIAKNHTGLLAVLNCESEAPRYLSMRGANNFRRGARTELHSGEVSSLEEIFGHVDMVYLNGYSLFGRHSDVWLGAMLERLRRVGIPLMVDVGGVACHGHFRPLLCELIRESCLVKMNRREATCFTHTSAVEDQTDALRPLLKNESAVCLISMDKDGCIAFTKDTVVQLPAPEISKINNADGAGDILLCTFAWNYLMRRLNIRDSLEGGITRATNWIVQKNVPTTTLDLRRVIQYITREM